MASKTPGGGGGFGRGSSGGMRGGGQKKIVDIKTKKPLTKAEIKKREDNIARKKAIANTAVTKGQVKYSTSAKPAQKPLKLNNRGVAVATAGTAVAAVGTVKGMKKAGEMNAARIRRNKSKSVPVPRDRKKQ